MEIQMPVDSYWKAQEILKEVDYNLAANEDQAKVKDIYRRLFKTLAPFAVEEKDRMWLTSRGKGGAKVV